MNDNEHTVDPQPVAIERNRSHTNRQLGELIALLGLTPKWLLHALQAAGLFRAASRDTLVWQLERHARRRPSHPFLLYREHRYGYADANALSNRYAHFYDQQGIAKGDVVALAIENRPEFFWHVFGLMKLGA